MTRHRAAIFDMDGVLIDSDPFWREAEIEVFRGVGVSLTEADCALTMGRRIDEVVDHWYARRPWTDVGKPEVARATLHVQLLTTGWASGWSHQRT
jgi:beta-phosphoglucomutase-like phosphatase (HAD superfamily)